MYTVGNRKDRAPMYSRSPSVFYTDGGSARKLSDQHVHEPWAEVGAWFLGPKGENGDMFRDLVMKAIDHHIEFRQTYYPSDPAFVTNEMKNSICYKETKEKTEMELEKLLAEMDKSVPFFSTRYKGHVLWDTALPANLGYIASILYNQNNCINEAGSVTSKYEIEVGKDLCEMLGFDREKCRGHLTSGGTIANIESLWAARNVKLLPLACKSALEAEPSLQNARDEFEIFLPQRSKRVRFMDATTWELLNLDVDAVLDIVTDVLDIINKDLEVENKLSYIELMNLFKKYTVESLGFYEFYKRHKIEAAPCVLAPTTAHISLLKAMNIVGLGTSHASLVSIPVDENARMNIRSLEQILEEKLEQQCPVVSVVAVTGTTEESAVDPLADIFSLRETMRKKGLNFSVHADGAWGGYFCSMLREPPPDHHVQYREPSVYVPELSLSEYVHKHLSMLCDCDTVTIDPHKSGFCPYPAGGICYRDKRMNLALSVTVEVPYYHGKTSLGNWGLEGSKPGAAAAGVMFANRVIGLHKNGYGRILAECMYNAKILYCLWATLGEKDDNFYLKTTKPLYSSIVDDPIKYIREHILCKDNSTIAKDQKTMDFLREVGPDTMVPCFAVNLKGNKDVRVCNAINNALKHFLLHSSDVVTARRRPMIVTASTMRYAKGSQALHKFKERLGLDTEKDKEEGVKYIITTCMDPWATSIEFMDDFARIMRNAILCSVGTVDDTRCPDFHTFFTTGKVDEDQEMIVYYKGSASLTSHQYNVLAKFKFFYKNDVEEVMKGSSAKEPLVFKTREKMTLHQLIVYNIEQGGDGLVFHVDCYSGLPSEDNKPSVTNVKLQVVDIARYDHFDFTTRHCPQQSTFFLYGDRSSAFLAHIPNKWLDFLQLVELGGIPEHVDEVLLRTGVEMTLREVPYGGQSREVAGPVTCPHEYEAMFIGNHGVETKTIVKIYREIYKEGNLYRESIRGRRPSGKG